MKSYLLLASPVPQLSPDYLQREVALWFYLFLFSKRGTKISLSPYKGSSAMRYPPSAMKVKSSSSSPGVDWAALEGEAAAEMVSLHPAALNPGTHILPPRGLLDTNHHLLHQPGVQHEVLLTESGFLGEQLLAARSPHPGSSGRGWRRCPRPAGRETAEISRGGCVGCESFSGAGSLAGLASKASLDVRRWRTTLIYSYSFFPHSCVAASHRLDPRRKIQLWAASGSSPKSDAVGAALFLSQSAQPNPHPQRAQGDGCRGEAWEALSQVYFCWQTLFNCLGLWPIWEDIGFFSRVHPHARPALGKVLVFHQWSQIILLLLLLLLFPRKLPVCLSHGTRACDSMSHLGDAMSHQGRPGERSTGTGNLLLRGVCCGQPQTPIWALGWCVFQRKPSPNTTEFWVGVSSKGNGLGSLQLKWKWKESALNCNLRQN